MKTCEEHDDCIVIYEGNKHCPICDLVQQFDETKSELENALADLEAKENE